MLKEFKIRLSFVCLRLTKLFDNLKYKFYGYYISLNKPYFKDDMLTMVTTNVTKKITPISKEEYNILLGNRSMDLKSLVREPEYPKICQEDVDKNHKNVNTLLQHDLGDLLNKKSQ